ncbi:Nuclear hormone receptor family member nhr-34 [Aphelenchoides besseyi]|nr:Nuclear hormone receptor family member nhr-34 [Aphelenchoides besseyi]KAI6210063.1 Nuclear hormone receptor family member nhr-34 [Aphelenchoides besseyi]
MSGDAVNSTGCKICGSEKASKHYSGTCCARCKTFFRRTVKLNKKYKCENNNDCPVNVSDRRRCKACRWRRSLFEGLDPKLVQEDRVRHQKETSPNVISLAKTNKMLNSPFDGPLGCKTPLPLPSTNDFRSVLKYFKDVDNFVDDYCDTGLSHTGGSFFDFDINMAVPQACQYPGRLSSRTKILWQANSWITVDSIVKIWCRAFLHYVDCTSFIPELNQLEVEDRLRLVVNRSSQFCWLMIIHRTFKYTKQKCLLSSGGSFFPIEQEEVEQFKASFNGNKFMTHFTDLGITFYDTFIGSMRDLQITDEEFVLLRLITFFVQVNKLSEQGREVVRSAQSRYQSLLVDYLSTKYHRVDALQRLTQLLSFLSMIESNAMIHDNHMVACFMFDQSIEGTLTHDFYIARNFRD